MRFRDGNAEEACRKENRNSCHYCWNGLSLFWEPPQRVIEDRSPGLGETAVDAPPTGHVEITMPPPGKFDIRKGGGGGLCDDAADPPCFVEHLEPQSGTNIVASRHVGGLSLIHI